MISVSSFLALVKIVVVSQHKKDNEANLCQDLLTIENTDLDLKVRALRYVNELLVYVRLPYKNFCKLAKQAETIRNYQKQVLVWFGKLANLLNTRVKSFLT